MKCKWTDCENEARAKSPYCSGTCKKRYQRASGTNVPVGASGTEPTPQDAPQSPNGGEVVAEHPTLRDLCKDKPCRLRKHVRAAGVVAEHPAVPGDVRGMSDLDLQLRLKSYSGSSWIGTPAHREVLKRRGLHEVKETGWTPTGGGGSTDPLEAAGVDA